MSRMDFADLTPTGRRHDPLLALPSAKDSNLFRVLAHLDEPMANFCELAAALRYGGTLDPQLREIAVLRVAKRTNCEYEVGYHELMIADMGLAPELISQIYSYPDAPGLSDLQRASIACADSMVDNFRADDESFEYLKRHLSARDLHELVMNIAFYLMASSYMNSFDIELEDNFREKYREGADKAVEAARAKTS